AALVPYLDQAGSAEIEHRLDLLAADHPWRPGAYVAAIEDGRGPSFAIAARSVITSRAWTFGRDGYGTRIRLEPLTLDLRSYL
ncbi:MAG: hypothetical protein RIR00_852, partial [Pseudomonadota bacterium]